MDPLDADTTDQSKLVAALTAAGRGLTRLPVIIIGFGVLAILIGYNGAAGYTALSAQFPYLISGGVLGLSLIIVGSSLLVAQSNREDSTRIEALLTQLLESGGLEQAPNDLSELITPDKTSANPGYAPKARAKKTR